MPHSVLIAGAVAGEVEAIRQAAENPVFSAIGRRSLLSGFICGKAVQIIVTGPGLLNTAQALTAVIEHSRPGLLIQTGCAGVFRQSGLEIGDIGIATAETDAHLGIESEEAELPEELPFALMTQESREIRNVYPLDAEKNRAAEIPVQKVFEKICRVKKGHFVTVSTITASDARADILYRKHSPVMENMEGAAAAYLGLFYDIPCIEIRSACNYAGKRERGNWNLKLAFERCATAVLSLLRDPVFLQADSKEKICR
ncbi:MAG: futalosine hydrolase [Desulfococcaceae bacterium]